jgi:hypothetical protein
MRKSFSVMGAVVGICLLVVPASGAPLAGSVSKNLALQAQSGDSSLLVQAQYRHGGGPRYRGRGGRHDGGDGGAVAAGVIGGLLLGAIIASEAQRGQSVQYCIQRYRSYDPNSQTYLGNDGRRHRCP